MEIEEERRLLLVNNISQSSAHSLSLANDCVCVCVCDRDKERVCVGKDADMVIVKHRRSLAALYETMRELLPLYFPSKQCL